MCTAIERIKIILEFNNINCKFTKMLKIILEISYYLKVNI